MADTLHARLDPARFPNMSLQMAAILGFVLDRAYTTPALAELVVTPDGHVLARPAGEVGPMAYLAAEADLRANLCRLGMAAGLDEGEWADYAARIRQRLGMELGGPGTQDRPRVTGQGELPAVSPRLRKAEGPRRPVRTAVRTPTV